MLKVYSNMVKSYGVVGGGGLLDYIVSFLGQVIAIVISRPRSLTIVKLQIQIQSRSIPGSSQLHSKLFQCILIQIMIWTRS